MGTHGQPSFLGVISYITHKFGRLKPSFLHGFWGLRVVPNIAVAGKSIPHFRAGKWAIDSFKGSVFLRQRVVNLPECTFVRICGGGKKLPKQLVECLQNM